MQKRKENVTIHQITQRGTNGQILAKFGAKNYRKNAAYGVYVSILRKFFPPKLAKYGRFLPVLNSYKKTRKIVTTHRNLFGVVA